MQIYRFRVTNADTGRPNEYLVPASEDECTASAANRLQGMLGTNDNVHEAYPAARPADDDKAIFTIPDLPCAMPLPDSVGLWLWWADRNGPPHVVEVTGGRHSLLINPANDRSALAKLTLKEWAAQHGTNRPFTQIHRPD